jgi:hypothetical protein
MLRCRNCNGHSGLHIDAELIFGITSGMFNWNCILVQNRDLGTFVLMGFSPNPPLLCKPRDRRASDGFIMFADVARRLSNVVKGKHVPIY